MMLADKDLVVDLSAAILSVKVKTSTILPLPFFATTATFSCSVTRMVARADKTLNSFVCSFVGTGGDFPASGFRSFGWFARWSRESIVKMVRKALISSWTTGGVESSDFLIERSLVTLENALAVLLVDVDVIR